MRLIRAILLLFGGSLAASAEESPDFAWVRTFPGTAYRVASDSAGNTYFFGNFSGTGAFGANVLSATNGQLVLAKLDREGNWLWVRQAGSNNQSSALYASAVISDSSGDVLVSGWLGGGSNVEAQFGSTTILLNGSQIFVAKYDSQGALLWARPTSAMSAYHIEGIATDRSNSTFVGGYGNPNVPFLLKLDSAGNELWQLKTTQGDLVARDLAVDNDGNCYFGGSLMATNVVIDGINLTALPYFGSYARSACLARVEPSGNMVWARTAGPVADSYAVGIALDSQTNLIATGDTRVDVPFFGYEVPDFQFPTNFTFGYSPFLLKIAATGSNLWLRYLPCHSSYGGYGWAAAVDAEDSVYVTGSFSGSMLFAGSLVAASATSDGFLGKLGKDGNFRSLVQFGGGGYIQNLGGRGLSAGPDGLSIAGVSAGGNTRFGSLTLNNATNTFFVGLVPYPTPQLSLQSDGADLQLGWPTFPPGFALETTTDLTSGWTTNPMPFVTANSSNLLTVPLAGQQQFFRLRKP